MRLYQLADYVGVPQANIAFCERSEKPPRSDVLPKMAEALGVAVEDWLIVGDEKSARRKTTKRNARPAGKVREIFDRVSKLPAASRNTSSTGSLLTSLSTSNRTELTIVRHSGLL